MQEVAVIDDPAAAEASLDPVRARLLAELAEPGSASTLGARVGMPRQKVNYHLRTLERHGLVELVEERRKGNCVERVVRATARSADVTSSDSDGAAWSPLVAGGVPVAAPPQPTRSARTKSGAASFIPNGHPARQRCGVQVVDVGSCEEDIGWAQTRSTIDSARGSS